MKFNPDLNRKLVAKFFTFVILIKMLLVGISFAFVGLPVQALLWALAALPVSLFFYFITNLDAYIITWPLVKLQKFIESKLEKLSKK